MRFSTLLLVLLNAFVVLCHASEEDHVNLDPDQTEYKQNLVWDTIHWLATVTALLVLPSISVAAMLAHKSLLSTKLNIISTLYAFIDLIFLKFNDPNGHALAGSSEIMIGIAGLLSVATICGLLYHGRSHHPQWPNFNDMCRAMSCGVLVLSSIGGWSTSYWSAITLLGLCPTTDVALDTEKSTDYLMVVTGLVAYGYVLLLVVQIPWLRENTLFWAQDFFDSFAIALSGYMMIITSVFSENSWSYESNYNTAMGIIWLLLGVLGIRLTINGQRSYIPGLVIAFTGLSKPVPSLVPDQYSKLSTILHYLFKLALMSAGFARYIEIRHLLKNKRFVKGKIMTLQYFCPTALVVSGTIYLSANEKHLKFIHYVGINDFSYIMVALSAAASVLYSMVMLANLYLKFVDCDKYGGTGYIGVVSDKSVDANVAEFGVLEKTR